MDKDLIERIYGACARTMVERLRTDRKTLLVEREAGRYGYKENWSDPRNPRKDLWQDSTQEWGETPIIKRSKERGL